MGVARSAKGLYGVRVPAGGAEPAWETLFPDGGPYIPGTLTFEIAGLPIGMPPAAIQELLAAWSWKARIIKSRVTKWQRLAVVASESAPQAATLVAQWQDRIFECVAKQVEKKQRQSPRKDPNTAR